MIACLTCRHSRKLKLSGAGEALCIISGDTVKVMASCDGWDSLFAPSQLKEIAHQMSAGRVGVNRYVPVTRTETDKTVRFSHSNEVSDHG